MSVAVSVPNSPVAARPPLPAKPDSFTGLRLARPGDEERLLDFCLAAVADNGWWRADQSLIVEVIDNCVHGRGGFVCALAESPREIEAAIILRPHKEWYADDSGWFYGDLGTFVRADCRNSRHAINLLKFARWWAEHTGVPVILGVCPKIRLLEKTAFFMRYGKLVGTSIRFGR